MTGETGPHPACVVLVGPPGAGKSTIGRKLARELGAELIDTDAVIEAETGRTIPEIFTADGEPEFRRIEQDVVRRAVLAERGIVSLGGGAILSAATRELLRDRTVVYLEISVAEGLRRTGATTHRPLLAGTDPAAKYRELMRIRRSLYREVATVRVRTEGRSPGRVVRNILARLGLEPVEPKLIPAQTHPTDTAGSPQPNRRSRRRRRGGRSGANKPTATNSTAAQGVNEPTTAARPGAADSSAARPNSTDTAELQPPRRSRRSRRGGRRRSKNSNDALTQGQGAPTPADPGSESSTAGPPSSSGVTRGRSRSSRSGSRRRGESAAPPRAASNASATTEPGEKPASVAAQQRSARSRRPRAARRPAGPPASNPDPGAAVPDSPHPRIPTPPHIPAVPGAHGRAAHIAN